MSKTKKRKVSSMPKIQSPSVQVAMRKKRRTTFEKAHKDHFHL